MREVDHLHVDSAVVRPGGRTARVGQAVMDATRAELSEVGYADLKVEAVATRAGVNKTTIYRRWGSKVGLVATAVLDGLEAAVPPPDTGTLRGDLIELIGEIRRGMETPWVAAVVRGTLGGGPEHELHELRDRIWSERFRASRVVVLRAVKSGELPVDVDIDFFLEALSGPLYFHKFMLGARITDRFAEQTVDLVLGGAGTATVTDL